MPTPPLHRAIHGPANATAHTPQTHPMWCEVLDLQNGRRFGLHQHRVYTIGRAPSCDIYVLPFVKPSIGEPTGCENVPRAHVAGTSAQGVSRVHCTIKWCGDGSIRITDCSSNGTIVNGHKVHAPAARVLAAGRTHEVQLAEDVFFLVSGRGGVVENAQTSSPYYITRHELGRGSYSVVRLAIDKRTHARLACKIVDKSLTPLHTAGGRGASVARECGILRRVDHPNIIRLHAVYTTPNHAYIMLTLVKGRDLYEEIRAQGRMPEWKARFALFQVVRALAWLHSGGVVHRDIKIENILVDSSHHSGLPRIMLGDFGMAKVLVDESALKTRCGTAFYLAPEMVTDEGKPYDKAVDIWAAGVVLYMLGGVFPFYSPSDIDLRRAIATTEPVFFEPQFSGVSEQAKDLVRCMLCKDPTRRPSAEDVLEHPWLAAKRTTLEKLYYKAVLSQWTPDECENMECVERSDSSRGPRVGRAVRIDK